MSATTQPKNSTNVRLMRSLGAHAPWLAARVAEEMFLTARRRERPAKEDARLAGARRTRVRYAGAHVPVWTWEPAGCAERATVVLVHGWEGRGAQLGAFVDPLLARGLRVVAFDAPGHGESPLRRASIVEHARALVAVSEKVAPRGVHAVVGHSVGAAAALLATRFGLRPARLALLAPPTSPARFAAGFARMVGLDDHVRDAMLRRLEARYGIAVADLDVTRDAARLSSPLLIVHDADDRVVPLDDGAAIAAASPVSELVTTRGLGHGRVLEAPPVVERVVGFVARGARAPGFEATLEGELFLRDTRW